jgi:hypothetical protein
MAIGSPRQLVRPQDSHWFSFNPVARIRRFRLNRLVAPSTRSCSSGLPIGRAVTSPRLRAEFQVSREKPKWATHSVTE